MILVAATIDFDPAGADAAREAGVVMMEATHKEEGNIEYAFSFDFADPGKIRIFEKWVDQAALDAHFAEPHMAAFQAALGGLDIKGTVATIYEIASERPFGA